MAQYGSSSGPIGPINPYEIDRRLGMPVDSMAQNMRNARQQEAAPLYANALEEAILAQQSQAQIPADVQAQKLADVYRRNAQVPRTYGSQQGPTSMLSDKGLQFKPIDHTAFLGSVAADNKNLAGSLGKGVDAAGNAGRNLAHLLGVGVEQQGNQMRLESDKMRFAPKTPEEQVRVVAKELYEMGQAPDGIPITPQEALETAWTLQGTPGGGAAGPPMSAYERALLNSQVKSAVGGGEKKPSIGRQMEGNVVTALKSGQLTPAGYEGVGKQITAALVEGTLSQVDIEKSTALKAIAEGRDPLLALEEEKEKRGLMNAPWSPKPYIRGGLGR